MRRVRTENERCGSVIEWAKTVQLTSRQQGLIGGAKFVNTSEPFGYTFDSLAETDSYWGRVMGSPKSGSRSRQAL